MRDRTLINVFDKWFGKQLYHGSNQVFVREYGCVNNFIEGIELDDS